METQGRVLRAEGSRVLVEVKRQSACTGNCKDCSGCEVPPMRSTALSDIPVSVGDWVLLRSDQGAVLFGLFAVFILPLICPLAVYLILLPWKFAWMPSVFALGLSIVLIWLLSKSKWFMAKTTPRIVEILPEEKY